MVNTMSKRQLSPGPESTKQTAKRARAADKPALRKHERFWLVDGNAVIELDGISFRVHQSWLAQHSKFIAKLLPEKIEETKFVVCEKLNAIDFEALLLYYENPGDYRNNIDSATLISLIRAAITLGFTSDYVWLVKELEALWPSKLEALPVNPEPRPDAPQLAALARTFNIDTLLKPAFYDMARTSGFGLDKLEEAEKFSHADMLRLVRMREYLGDTWAQVATREDPTLVCQNLRVAQSSSSTRTSDSTTSVGVARNCLSCFSETARREAWVRLVHDSGTFTRYRYDPLCGLAALINVKWTDDWCKNCKEKRQAEWREMQASIWEKIDEYLRKELPVEVALP
ncbi:uncharacterized protein EDB91DRAFT_1172678 [Suillus paluster]|uniref:uncharacterized protein n=1 Tax=Suillus paluster TaxID=48578 RepID=UPI001B875D76|nr:uncharacterized protein EDB91DRAFT_1172678 [Suillus paluster]KAG1723476.1 hypothetical protein EDB91DRAFT_1172678 [Suillus paluster]